MSLLFECAHETFSAGIVPIFPIIFHLCWHHSMHSQEMCCPGIHPQCGKGVHLSLFHHIYNSPNSGGSQYDGHSFCKMRRVCDDQGYLVFIIAPNSIYLNLDYCIT